MPYVYIVWYVMIISSGFRSFFGGGAQIHKQQGDFESIVLFFPK
jgi:hypothetical protein